MTGGSSTFNPKINPNLNKAILRAHPSRTALPNGHVEKLPPKNRFHIVCAKVIACLFDSNPTRLVAPPRLKVVILPLAWQDVASKAKEAQLGRLNVVLSVGLYICVLSQHGHRTFYWLTSYVREIERRWTEKYVEEKCDRKNIDCVVLIRFSILHQHILHINTNVTVEWQHFLEIRHLDQQHRKSFVPNSWWT